MTYQRFRVQMNQAVSGGSDSVERKTVASLATVAAARPDHEAVVRTRSGLENSPWKRFRVWNPLDLGGNSTPATVATNATESPSLLPTVATVAAHLRERHKVLSAYIRLFGACTYGPSEPKLRIVEHFLDEHLPEARRLGWSDVDLFGCYPDSSFAGVRYDAMGAVTLAALTASPIGTVSSVAVYYPNGLASRRPLPCARAEPVWVVFPRQNQAV